MYQNIDKYALTKRLSEAAESSLWPQAEAWGFDTITALRAEKFILKRYT